MTAPRAGPPTGKPIQVQLAALDPDVLPAAAKKVAGDPRAAHADIRDLDDGLPLPGIDWKIEVDKAEAAKYGAGVSTVGTAVQLVTNGIKVTEYRPSDSDKAVDILVRFPSDRRSLDQIDELRVQTAGRPCADRQFRRARAGAARRLHQPRRRQPRDDGVGQRRRRRADARRCSRRSRRSSPRPISARASPSG